MATYNKFQDFVQQLCQGVHALQAAGNTFKVYLTNATPNAATQAGKADLAEITAEYGYPSGGTDVQNDMTETSGTATVTGVDVVFTASGGSFGPFRYVVLYNDTPTTPLADPLVAWWDYGSALTVNNGETFTVDFGASIFTLS